jgi:hypothetical protein
VPNDTTPALASVPRAAGAVLFCGGDLLLAFISDAAASEVGSHPTNTAAKVLLPLSWGIGTFGPRFGGAHFWGTSSTLSE